MRTLLSFLIPAVIAFKSHAQACSEIIKLRYNPSRYLTLSNDSGSTCVAHIDKDNEINEIDGLLISGELLTSEKSLPKGNIYAGKCNFENQFKLFYFYLEDNDTYGLYGVSGNSRQLLTESSRSIARLACDRKNLPYYLHAIEDARGIYVCIPPYESNSDNSAMQLLVLDKSMQVIKEKKLILPYGGNTLETLQILPDNQGNFYILTKQKIISRAKHPLSRHFLFYYNFQRNSLKEYDLQLQGKNITDAHLQFNPQQNIILSGFFSEDLTMQVNGVFHSQIKALGGSMSAIRTRQFLERGLEALSSDRNAQSAIPDLELDGMTIDSAGIFLWGERRYSTEHTGIDPLTGRVYNEIRYHYDDIVVARLDSSGKLISNNIIQKQQTTRDETLFTSYHPFRYGAELHFAYNDYPTSRGDSNTITFWNSSKSFISALASVTGEGIVKYRNEKYPDNLRIIPHLCAGSMLFHADGKEVRVCECRPD